MDNNKKNKTNEDEDIRGFEEFIEGQNSDQNFLPKGAGGAKKNEAGFGHFTFLTNDAERLRKLNLLLSKKLPFSSRFDQSDKLIKEQREELDIIKSKLFEFCDKEDSRYRKSLNEIFDSFFGPSKG